MSHDPHFEREQQKYDNPIPSREFILEWLNGQSGPCNRDQIGQALGLSGEDQWEGLRRRLRAMERDGQLVFTRNKCYALPERMDMILGRVMGHKDGFGFLRPDHGDQDLFIPYRCMSKYFDGDRVMAQPLGVDKRGRREVRLVRLLEPRKAPIVGRFHKDGSIAFVTPQDKRIPQDILIDKGMANGAREGDICVVDVLERATHFMAAKGQVREILGEENAPGMEIEIALRNYDLPHQWNQRIDRQLRKLSDEVVDDDKTNRVDLRHLPLVTIDGSDARDFDDAVYAERKRSGWRLWVAIADVSHYVKKGSALDEEAIARGNSVYFPSQVIPMLPEKLSNGLCSLKPKVDRLAMVCEMTISDSGSLSGYKFYPAVIHSHARLIYEQVADALEQGTKDPNLERLLPHLEVLQELYLTLNKAREERGAIAFETEETQFIFNDQRKIESIVPRSRNQAHKIIEECMILANVAAARFIKKHKAETLYRVHQSPSETKLTSYREFVRERGLTLGGGDEPQPMDYSNLLGQIGDRDDAELIQIMLLRSMSQAQYSPDEDGHFGLALNAYAHFTSPIRRYPDLQLHRSIRYLLNREAAAKAGKPITENWTRDGGYFYQIEELDELGVQCSTTERRADDATREVSDWLKCEYMQAHLGDEFDAVIASVTSFGFFARLKGLFIDGLVHVSSLANDYYHFDSGRQMLQGESSARSYRIGDAVRVKIAAVNLDDKQIDMVLVDNVKSRAKSGRTAKASSGRSKAKGSIRSQLARGEIGGKSKSSRSTSSKAKGGRGKSGGSKSRTSRGGKSKRQR
ncbi:ribonuclease R [Paraferrimonas sedimenticola]|uniref:Ribonuclease R n=1 Tax=Paraferrimonas sedimenticola TaxID=375674 RepID=A0AA37RV12_9GAMM|nr:ribonuclease R [Paraferrimonas sedimenticola]GLP95731.1 ribonuclease R [Paraferrimonas sedimenticola]